MILREVWKFCEESVKEIMNLREHFCALRDGRKAHAEAN
jgi:hypothetical protein